MVVSGLVYLIHGRWRLCDVAPREHSTLNSDFVVSIGREMKGICPEKSSEDLVDFGRELPAVD